MRMHACNQFSAAAGRAPHTATRRTQRPAGMPCSRDARMERNRISAAKHRTRRLQAVANLHAEVASMRAELSTARAEASALQASHSQLAQQHAELQDEYSRLQKEHKLSNEIRAHEMAQQTSAESECLTLRADNAALQKLLASGGIPW